MALLHALTNSGNKVGGFVEKSFLDEFTTTLKDASPEDRARHLENSKELEEIHASFAK